MSPDRPRLATVLPVVSDGEAPAPRAARGSRRRSRRASSSARRRAAGRCPDAPIPPAGSWTAGARPRPARGRRWGIAVRGRTRRGRRGVDGACALAASTARNRRRSPRRSWSRWPRATARRSPSTWARWRWPCCSGCSPCARSRSASAWRPRAREEARVRDLERQLFHAERLTTVGRLAAGHRARDQQPAGGDGQLPEPGARRARARRRRVGAAPAGERAPGPRPRGRWWCARCWPMPTRPRPRAAPVDLNRVLAEIGGVRALAARVRAPSASRRRAGARRRWSWRATRSCSARWR